MVGLGVVGFIDDFLKTRKQRSLGLTGWAKVAGQVIVATVLAFLAIKFPNGNGYTPAIDERLAHPRPARSTSCRSRSSA